MNQFIVVFDTEFNISRRVNLSHIVTFYDNNSGTGRGQIYLSTGKFLNTSETPEEIEEKISKAVSLPLEPCIEVHGPSGEQIAEQISISLARAVESLKEIPSTKSKKGKGKETQSPEGN